LLCLAIRDRNSAKLALEASDVVEKTINIGFRLSFGYAVMNNVMRIVKERNLNITSQQLELDCTYVISVRKKDAAAIFEIFTNLYKVEIIPIDF
jgi:putative IMPACT (imprinted ancient) family translation regulator